jgi:hypothetical protein
MPLVYSQTHSSLLADVQTESADLAFAREAVQEAIRGRREEPLQLPKREGSRCLDPWRDFCPIPYPGLFSFAEL